MAARTKVTKILAMLALAAAAVVMGPGAVAGDAGLVKNAAERTQRCASSADARARLTDAVVGGDQIAARVDSGRPSQGEVGERAPSVAEWLAQADAAQWPGGQPREDGRLWAYVPINHRDVVRVLCDPRTPDAACAMCAWYEVQAVGSKLWVPVDGRVDLARSQAAEHVLVATLESRSRLAQSVQLARLAAATNAQ